MANHQEVEQAFQSGEDPDPFEDTIVDKEVLDQHIQVCKMDLQDMLHSLYPRITGSLQIRPCVTPHAVCRALQLGPDYTKRLAKRCRSHVHAAAFEEP